MHDNKGFAIYAGPNPGMGVRMSEHTPEPLGLGLTDAQLSLRPVCYVCNWRKGGVDSWNGAACKCGLQSRTFRELFGVAREARAALAKAEGA